MKKLISLMFIVGCGAYEQPANKSLDNPLDTKTGIASVPAGETEAEYKYPQTLYIATLGDVPTCGPENTRQLIYVAETADFRACLGNDWTVVDMAGKPGTNTIENQEIRTETTVVVEKPVIVNKIDYGFVITPEMPKYHYVHTETNDSDNKLGALDYWIYSATVVKIDSSTVLLTFNGFGNGDGVFSHGRVMAIGTNADFYYPGKIVGGSKAPVLKVTVNGLGSVTIERTQSTMTGTATDFVLIAE